MIIDAKTTKISLEVNPEDYKIIYKFESSDLNKDAILKLLSNLLTFEIDKNGCYTTSIIDLYIFNVKFKSANFNDNINYTKDAFDIYKLYLERRVDVINIKEGNWNNRITTTLKSSPYEDQKPAIAFLLARCHAGNFSSVGIGKSYSVLAAFNILKDQGLVNKLLILCLNNNKLTWKNEIEKHTNYTYKIVRNGTQEVIEDIDNFSDEDILVVHYDSLINNLVLVSLLAKNFNIVAADEAHVLRNYGKRKHNKKTRSLDSVCQRADAAFNLCETYRAKYIFPLTGTPVPENPAQAYAILKLLCPKLIPSRTKFEGHFCNFIEIPAYKGSKFKIKVLNKKKPYKNLDQLAILLDLYSYRITQDAVKGFPPTVISIREVEIVGEQRKLYNKIEAETFADIAKVPEKAMNLHLAFVKTLRARQCLTHPKLLGESKIDSSKFLELDNILEEILDDPKQKVVIFSSFRESLELLTERYKNYGAVIYAGTNSDLTYDERDLNVQLFLSNADTRILVCNTCLGIGGNYGQVARTGIFVDLPNERLFLKQSIGRITRRDAVGTSNIIFLLGSNTVDTKLWKFLNSKNLMSDSIIGRDQDVEVRIEDITKR